MANYSDGLRQLILKVLERDIYWLSRQRHIPGLDQEDVAQELRLTVWEYGSKYNPYKASINTWGKILLKGKLNKLYRDHCTTNKRKINAIVIPFSHFGYMVSDEKDQNPYEDTGL